MNTLGTMFYREDWQLFSAKDLHLQHHHEHEHKHQHKPSARREGDDQASRSLQSTLECISEQVQYRGDDSSGILCCRSRCNGFSAKALAGNNQNSLLSESRNPFEIDRGRMVTEANKKRTTSIGAFDWNDERIKGISKLLENYIGGEDATASKLYLKSVVEGAFPWTARLLLIIDKLPALAEDAGRVMISMVDLYVTTAFRVCAGNGRNERILLGIDNFYDAPKQNGTAHPNRSTSPMFDFGLRSQAPNNRPAPVISATAEAELCALVPEESGDLDSLREFLLESKKRMEGVAKLDLVDNWISDPAFGESTIEEDFAEETVRVMTKRQGASCNHIFLALGLFVATRNIPSSCKNLKEYTDQVLRVFPLLINVCNRISCMRAIRGSVVLREIVSIGSVWEESKLHERANDYVDEFCEFLVLLWRYLYTCPDRLPVGILKVLWENLVGGGYMVLLDGFSKVSYCSTEGRALMSMDVASYRSGISARSIASRLEDDQHPSCPLPTDIQPYRTTAYVDTYIKIFYFPSEDALEWIRCNFQHYHRHHIMALVINDRDAKNLANQVLDCYRGAEAGRVATTMRI